AGTRDLVGSLLARAPALAGLTHIALGTGTGAAEGRLAAEEYRVRIDPPRLAYDPAAHTVEASASFAIAEGPADVREAGLFGGTATDDADTGLLRSRDGGENARSEPKPP